MLFLGFLLGVGSTIAALWSLGAISYTVKTVVKACPACGNDDPDAKPNA